MSIYHRTNYVHRTLQASAVAFAEGRPSVATELAQKVLDLIAGQEQALEILKLVASGLTKETGLIDRSVGGSFFLQRMVVQWLDERFDLFTRFVAGRRVLHVGCTDWPILDVSNCLHAKLSEIAEDLCGLDTDVVGLNALREAIPGNYYSSVDHVVPTGQSFDLLLVPETIEHVENAGLFLRDLDRLNFERWIITAPCVYGNAHFPTLSYAGDVESVGLYAQYMNPGSLIEEVHPDHKYWFTPYTLANLIESSVGWKIDEAWLMHDGRQIALVGSR